MAWRGRKEEDIISALFGQSLRQLLPHTRAEGVGRTAGEDITRSSSLGFALPAYTCLPLLHRHLPHRYQKIPRPVQILDAVAAVTTLYPAACSRLLARAHHAMGRGANLGMAASPNVGRASRKAGNCEEREAWRDIAWAAVQARENST